MTTNKLLGKTKNRILPNLPELIFTTKFANHFIDKIDNIHNKLTKLINLLYVQLPHNHHYYHK